MLAAFIRFHIEAESKEYPLANIVHWHKHMSTQQPDLSVELFCKHCHY